MERLAEPTRIGTIGSEAEPMVDDRGRVTPDGLHGDWQLDWWVGADDRWHLPEEESALRRSLVGAAPVVETRMRIPGGDAVHRAYGVRSAGQGGGQEFVVVEVENDSPVPFALALLVRPRRSPDQQPLAPGVRRIEVETTAGRAGRDAPQQVRVNTRPALLLPRAGARVAVGTGDGADLLDRVAAGAAGPWPPEVVVDGAGRAELAVVLPVTHRTTLRVLLPVGQVVESGWPVALPSVTQVVNGWTAQAERGARVDLPDPKAMSVMAAARRQLLLQGPCLDLLGAFDQLGWHKETAQALIDLCSTLVARDPPVAPGDDEKFLLALQEHWRLTRNCSVLTAAGDAWGVAANRVAGRFTGTSLERSALAVARDLFELAGDRRAAADVRAILKRSSPGRDAVRNTLAGTLVAYFDQFRASVIDDRGLGQLTLLPGWPATEKRDPATEGSVGGPRGAAPPPPSWYGQPIDVRDLPTAVGSLSFAVRWHGDRPALLWELRPHAGLGPVTISAPGLDPGWSTTESRGEALLAPIAAPEQPQHGTPAEGVITSAQPPRSVSPLVPSRPQGQKSEWDPAGEQEQPGTQGSFS